MVIRRIIDRLRFDREHGFGRNQPFESSGADHRPVLEGLSRALRGRHSMKIPASQSDSFCAIQAAKSQRRLHCFNEDGDQYHAPARTPSHVLHKGS
jgi:hypothetical protein